MEITVATYSFISLERLTQKEFELINRALHLMRATHPDEQRILSDIRAKLESVEEYCETIEEAKGELT